MATEQFRVPGMSCEHCVTAITNEVSGLEGVKRVKVMLGEKLVTVEHSDRLSTQTIISAIQEAGFVEVETIG